MSTYRERRLARAERLEGWAETREQKADAAHEASRAATAGIPFGQPILVGHHSQRRHERALEKARSAATASVEHSRTAGRMSEKAENIRAQVEHAIYDDDPDAIDRLTEKLAAMEERRETMKAANAAYRKAHRAELAAMSGYDRHHAVPHPSYEITNLGGNISRTRDRIARLTRERDRGPVDRMIFARFASECADCGAAIEKDQRIRYNRQQGARCVSCEEH